MEATDLSTLLSTLPGSVSQECKGVRNPDAVMEGEEEELGEFELGWKLLEELPDAVKEEEKHRGLSGGIQRGCGDLKEEDGTVIWGEGDTEQGPLGRSGNGNQN